MLFLYLKTYAIFLFTFESEIYIFQLQKNPAQSKLEDSIVEVVGPSVLHKYFSFSTHIHSDPQFRLDVRLISQSVFFL